MNIDDLKFDRSAAEAGRWYTHRDGSKYLVAEAIVSGYRKALSNKVDYLQRKHGVDNIPDLEDGQAMGECIANKLVKDWKGVVKNGKGLECTLENMILLFTMDHPMVRELRSAIHDFARDPDTWNGDAINEGVKVLGKRSNSGSVS